MRNLVIEISPVKGFTDISSDVEYGVSASAFKPEYVKTGLIGSQLWVAGVKGAIGNDFAIHGR